MKLLLKHILLVAACLLTMSAMAQKEANIWYFGDSAGLDFNTNPPTPLLNSQMSVAEGCASIADSNGNLLFYTDGMTIWNKQHQVMSNGTGIKGGNTPVQGNIIAQKPGSNTEYYLFTCTDGTNPNFPNNRSLNYSIIDMTLSAGLGAVTVKNVNLKDTINEGLCAVKHGGQNSIWIVVSDKRFLSDSLFAFELSSNGVSSIPVSSGFGGVGYTIQQHMTIKFSRNGESAVQRMSSSVVRVFEFDDTQGNFTLSYSINVPSYIAGLEFSPSGRYLYVSTGSPPYHVIQFDLNAGSQALVAASAINLPNYAQISGLQLAPNGKIYGANTNTFNDSLLVIHHPDSAGTSCQLESQGQFLGGKFSRQGLPQFVASMLKPQPFLKVSDTCQAEETQFDLSVYLANIDSVYWDFGDTASSNTWSTSNTVTHIFSGSDTFNVTATAFVSYYEDTTLVHDTLSLSKNIFIHPLPQIDLGNDTILCEGDSLVILNSNTTLSMEYLWSDSTTNEFLQVLEPNTYWVEASTLCGVAHDTIVIDSVLPAIVNFGPDSVLCVGDTLVLDAFVAGGNYSWQDNSTDSVFVVTAQGTYSVMASGICNTAYDTINLYFSDPVQDQLPPDTAFCVGQTAIFSVQADSALFLWSTGDTTDSIAVQSADTFIVEITNACGVFHDSVSVFIDYPLDPYLGNDTVLCVGDSHTYRLNLDGMVEYDWHNGAQVDTFQVVEPGHFWVDVSNTCGTFTDSLVVDYDQIPMISLPNDTVLCVGQTMNLAVSFSRSSYTWSTGVSDSNIVVSNTGNYSVTATNLCGLDSSDINIAIDYPLSVDLGSSIHACEGDSIKLGFSVPNEPAYQWSNGLRDSLIVITNSGRYHLTITNQCGSYSDDLYAYFKKVPIIGFPEDTIVCAEGAWLLKPADRFDSYKWQDGRTDNIYEINASGTYWLTAWSECGEARDTVSVHMAEELDLSLGDDTVLCAEMGVLKLNAYSPRAFAYDWNTGSSDPEIVVTNSGVYSVTVYSDSSCVTTDEIFVDDCPHYFYLPNSFSPNGDGVNEIFQAQGEYIDKFEMAVFDRWGNLLFKSNDINIGWDGKHKGKMLPIGIYAVRIKYSSNGVVFEKHDQVSLMH